MTKQEVTNSIKIVGGAKHDVEILTLSYFALLPCLPL